MSCDVNDFETADEPAKEAFRVNDDSSATWAMRKLKSLADQIRTNDEIYNKELERLTAWLTAVNTPLSRSAEFFEAHLIDYARRQREEQDRKSVSTPYGTVKSRVTPTRVQVDEPTFVAWAHDQCRDDLLTFSEPKPNKTEIKKAIEAGQDIRGVVLLDGGVNFSIEVSK